MAELTIVVATHHFTVRHIQARASKQVISFAQRYVQWGPIRVQQPGQRPFYKRGPIKVFGAATENRSEFRFHINVLKEFREHLALDFIKDEMIQEIHLPVPPWREVELPIMEGMTARDYQLPVIEYAESEEPPRSKLIGMQTGKGKSFCALKAISDLRTLAAVLVRPMYLDKWVIDIRKTYNIPLEDVLVVQGSKDLMALLLQAQAGLVTARIILVSNKTIQNWIKLYEALGEGTLDLGYVCTPDQFFEWLQVGFRLIDEVHQDFHLNFKIDLYTNVNRSLSLSATLLADDDFINKMYEIAYPAAERFEGPPLDKYIAAIAAMYRAADPRLLRWQDPASKNYSHHVFEKSVMRNKSMLENYFRMVNMFLRGEWLKNYVPGEKALVFCASIEMCTAMTAYLQRMYPDKDVRRYVEDDPYENLMEPDIRVTTLQSAGTAVDIPNLTVTVMTNALSSSQGNVQGAGRLRKLDSGKQPVFVYCVCEDIPKHLQYHEKKEKIFAQRAASFRLVRVNQAI